MFTGIIENIGTVNSIQTTPGGSRMVLHSPSVARELNVGDSVSVNGACLTKVAGNDDIFEVDVSPETLQKTNHRNTVQFLVNIVINYEQTKTNSAITT